MSCSGKDFVSFAVTLVKKNDLTQAEIRAVISRAYYGLFLYARDKARIEGGNNGIHQEVSAYYSSKVPEVSNTLNELRRFRNCADYQLVSPLVLRTAKSCCTQAGRAITLLDG